MKNLICLVSFIFLGLGLSAQSILIDDFSTDQTLLFALDGNTNQFSNGNFNGKVIMGRDGNIENIVFSDRNMQMIQDTPERMEKRVREAAAKSQCTNNLKQMMVATSGEVRNRNGKSFKVQSSTGNDFGASTFSIDQTLLFGNGKQQLIAKLGTIRNSNLLDSKHIRVIVVTAGG